MKRIFILVFFLVTTNAFGQTKTDKANVFVITPKQPLETDTTIKVIYADKTTSTPSPAWFLNGNFISPLQGVLNPTFIDSINVVNGIIQIDNVQYNGQIHIKTKSDYTPRMISLTDLKEKYITLKNKPTIFLIDGNLVNADYDKYMVDENYLLLIIVDNIKNPKENIDLSAIKLLTKTDENIKKSKEIIIRGTEVASKQ